MKLKNTISILRGEVTLLHEALEEKSKNDTATTHHSASDERWKRSWGGGRGARGRGRGGRGGRGGAGRECMGNDSGKAEEGRTGGGGVGVSGSGSCGAGGGGNSSVSTQRQKTAEKIRVEGARRV